MERFTEGGADAGVVLLVVRSVIAHRRIRSVDPAGDVEGALPVANADLVAGPALHREFTRLEVQEQRGIHGPELRGLANTGDAGQHSLNTAGLPKALVRGDDPPRRGSEASMTMPKCPDETGASSSPA